MFPYVIQRVNKHFYENCCLAPISQFLGPRINAILLESMSQVIIQVWCQGQAHHIIICKLSQPHLWEIWKWQSIFTSFENFEFPVLRSNADFPYFKINIFTDEHSHVSVDSAWIKETSVVINQKWIACWCRNHLLIVAVLSFDFAQIP